MVPQCENGRPRPALLWSGFQPTLREAGPRPLALQLRAVSAALVPLLGFGGPRNDALALCIPCNCILAAMLLVNLHLAAHQEGFDQEEEQYCAARKHTTACRMSM